MGVHILKKTKVFSQLLVLMLIVGLVLAACGKQPEGEQPAPNNGEQPATEAPADAFKVAMVTDTGGVNDNSFNQSAWEGHQKMKEELGYEIAYLESTSDDQYQPNLNQLVRQENNLVWGIGFLMADDLAQIAEANPNAKFGIVDFVYTDDKGNLTIPPNVVSVAFDEHEGSFLVGLIAGKMTKTNKVGFLGGVKFALIEKFEYGFMAGVKAANPDAEIISNYAGSFGDPAAGKGFAATMYDQGADIIYHASGGTGDGVFEEAKLRQGVWVIGVDKDQSFMGEDVTLTSMVKRVDTAVFQVSRETAEGNFPGGQVRSFGLAENGVGIAETKTHLTEEVLNLVEEYRQKVINGEIKVPQTADEYKEYLGTLK